MNDYKVNGITFEEKGDVTLVHMSQTGIDCTYTMKKTKTTFPIQYLLMDLDGTTVKSEEFWMLLIEKTVAYFLKDPSFKLEEEDIPYVSGFSTVQHLSYCINKYHLTCDVNDCEIKYHQIAKYELKEIAEGRGHVDAFKPRPGLKDFLYTLKKNNIKIGLATSGLDYKAIPEIVSTFKVFDRGDPLNFYDAIITGGRQKEKGQYGTVGELAGKPHPWIYAELGLGLDIRDKSKALVLEDSSAGLISAKTAGFNCIGFKDGNLIASHLDKECIYMADDFDSILNYLEINK